MDVANSENFALDGGRTTVWSSINQPADMVVVVHLIPGPFRVVLVNAALFCHYGFPAICYARAAVKNYSTNWKKLWITLRMRSIWDAAQITWTPLVSICHRVQRPTVSDSVGTPIC
jgi:hypothetical protein